MAKDKAGKAPPESGPADFELHKYDSDRVHELELNKFSHALEVERLKILQLVNGGAFTVVVGFSDALVQSRGDARWLAAAASVGWIAGLASAAWATQLTLDWQTSFSKAYNRRRRAIEWRRLRGISPDRRTRDPELEGRGDTCLEKAADDARQRGGELGRRVRRWAMVSVALFAAGALLMTLSLVGAAPA